MCHQRKARHKRKFQTKLTYGMICYHHKNLIIFLQGMFQTKLTYGMICYGLAVKDTFSKEEVSN